MRAFAAAGGLFGMLLVSCAEQPHVPVVWQPVATATGAAPPLVAVEPPRPKPDCATWAMCLHEGKCTVAGATCTAATDEDCAKSAVCRERGACRAIEGSCVQDCRSTTVCAEDGRCDEIERRCRVGTASDCQRSSNCKAQGACSMTTVGNEKRCEPRTTADCNRSPMCGGKPCIFYVNSCVPLDPCMCDFGTGFDFGDDVKAAEASAKAFASMRQQCIAAGGPVPKGGCKHR